MAHATARERNVSNDAHFAAARPSHRPAAMLIVIVEPRGADLRQVRELAARRGASFVEVPDLRLVAEALAVIDPDVVIGDLVSLAISAMLRPRARRVWLTDTPAMLDDAQRAAFGIERVWRSPLDDEPLL